MTVYGIRVKKSPDWPDETWFRLFLDGELINNVRVDDEIANALEQVLAPKQMCTWTYCPGQYGSSDYWETECGNAFQLASGTPTENDFHFCPYCGKRLEEKNE